MNKYTNNKRFKQELKEVGSPVIKKETFSLLKAVLDFVLEKYPKLDFQVLPDRFSCLYVQTCPVDEKGISLMAQDNGDIRMFLINNIETKRVFFKSISEFKKSLSFIEFIKGIKNEQKKI